ncbi:hypothetical protein OSB04_014744 [Centaurea solstitialis]|uniref:Uncharacterized protein n=1 Tax=Centaurea solstitialis TaxID=347529 RepID=A0AA38WI14_9ASTR|nr:hypothetical protein OSB04_014744 [Centaurea solstitialis]
MDHSESFGKLGWLVKSSTWVMLCWWKYHRGKEYFGSEKKKGQSGCGNRTLSGAFLSVSDFGDEILKWERGLRALSVLKKLVVKSFVWGEIDHRGSSVIAFLTQGFPGELGRKWDSLDVSKLMVPPGRLKGRAWLEVPISQEAQFCLVV